MNRKNKIAEIAVVLSVLAGLGKARGIVPTPGPEAELRYHASCSIVDFNSLDGYVSNLSGDAYRVRGEVRFKFYTAHSMSRPEILIPTDSLVPAGQTIRVSHAQMTFALRPGETCRFDVREAIQSECQADLTSRGLRN